MSLRSWQARFLIAGAVILPFSPLLFVQGRLTRRRVGVLPDAAGPNAGTAGAGASEAELLVIGESTVAGLGARTHETALAGTFAGELTKRIGKRVNWTAIGKNGVTARRTIRELVPLVPDRSFDYVLLGLGGNDVLKLSSPVEWRRSMTELIELFRAAHPGVTIFITNCPVIRLSPALPQPIRGILWELSKLHDLNIKELTSGYDDVFYYHQPNDVPEGFFADGIHPSESGYAEWSRAMMEFFDKTYRWKRS